MGRRFDEVYAAHIDAVYRYCLARTGSSHDAEDLTAEVFARYLTNERRVRDGAELGWLYAVARNVRSNDRRRDARMEFRERVPEVGTESALPAVCDDLLWQVVRDLPANQRHVVYLKVIEDRTFASVAALLGRSEGAVKMTYHRPIRSLRRRVPVPAVAPLVVGRVEGEAQA